MKYAVAQFSNGLARIYKIYSYDTSIHPLMGGASGYIANFKSEIDALKGATDDIARRRDYYGELNNSNFSIEFLGFVGESDFNEEVIHENS